MERSNTVSRQSKKSAIVLKKHTDTSVINQAILLAIAICLILILTAVMLTVTNIERAKIDEDNGPYRSPTLSDNTPSNSQANYPFRQSITDFYPALATNSLLIDQASISSTNAALVDMSSNTIIASCRSGKANTVYPASLTKIMTLICIYENLESTENLSQKLTISNSISDKMDEAHSSGYGFKAGDVLTVEELIYSVVFYSDGKACLTLAQYISGSEAKFVELMNAKAKEMGLQNTNFTNCTGLHNKYHYSTAQDLAAIMSYAMKNSFCASVITAQHFSLGSHFRSSEGSKYSLYNQLFESKNGLTTQPSTCTVYGGKTGYTDEANRCLMSYAKTKDGKEYILVTLGAESIAKRNEDQLYIYNKYIK